MNIYTIIVSYNGAEWIEKCLNSIIKSTLKSNIIIIDNNSDDNTIEIVEDKFPKASLIKLDKNKGFGKANNIGLKIAMKNKADFVFLLNQDAWIEPNTLTTLTTVFEKTKSLFGILSPAPFDAKGVNYDYLFKEFYIQEINKSHEYENKTHELPFINAAAWLIPSYIINKIGGFHPSFYLHGEDSNYTHRLQTLNKKTGVCFGTKYYHDRANRISTEDNSIKRFYAKKIAIKTSLFNPNTNIIKTLIINSNQLRLLLLPASRIKTQDVFLLFFHNLRYFCIALINRKIYCKL